MISRTLRVMLVFVALAAGAHGSPAAEAQSYSIVAHLPGTGGAWDYAVIDANSERLYLAQAGVTAVDLKTNTVTTGLVTSKMTHGLALLDDGNLAVDDSAARVITIFQGATGKIVATIPTASLNVVTGPHALDALVLEPTTGLLVAINGESGLVLLVDIKASSVVGTVSVGGHPEFAAADGLGRVYINVNRGKTTELVAVNVGSRKVENHFALEGCEEATGLAYDQADQLFLSVCDNGFLKAFDTRARRVVASVLVGRGADAVMFDSKRRRAFVPSGDDGTLSVIAVRSPTDLAVVQTLATQRGTRLGAVDVESGRVYLPTASFGPPKPPLPYPTVVPGTFQFLVVAPSP